MKNKRKNFFRFWLDEARYVMEKDPSANSLLSVMLLNPGIIAKLYHRISRFFYLRKLYFLADLFYFTARKLTGIEIHPGAKIGDYVFIDHGMGLVIGETAEIGNYCTLYHEVTLGAVKTDKVLRHPILKDHVFVGVGAKILGRITLQEGAKIGANAIVLKDVPAHSTAVGLYK